MPRSLENSVRVLCACVQIRFTLFFSAVATRIRLVADTQRDVPLNTQEFVDTAKWPLWLRCALIGFALCCSLTVLAVLVRWGVFRARLRVRSRHAFGPLPRARSRPWLSPFVPHSSTLKPQALQQDEVAKQGRIRHQKSLYMEQKISPPRGCMDF